MRVETGPMEEMVAHQPYTVLRSQSTFKENVMRVLFNNYLHIYRNVTGKYIGIHKAGYCKYT